jgi:hypothetical protein
MCHIVAMCAILFQRDSVMVRGLRLNIDAMPRLGTMYLRANT